MWYELCEKGIRTAGFVIIFCFRWLWNTNACDYFFGVNDTRKENKHLESTRAEIEECALIYSFLP